MAGSIVQIVGPGGASTAATNVVSSSITCTAGNTIWGIVISDDTTITSITDSFGGGANTYTERGSVIEAAITRRTHHFTSLLSTGGTGTVTVNFAASVANRQLWLVEITGIGAYDVQGTATDTGNNPTTAATATNTQTPWFAIAACVDYQGGTPTVGTGYTSGGTLAAGGQLSGLVEYKSGTGTGSQSANFGNAGFNRTVTVFAIFSETPPIPTGTLAYTNVNDTLSATGTGYSWPARRTKPLLGNGAFGAGAFGEQSQGSVGTSTPTGTLAYTNANDTLAASGTTAVTGSLAKTNNNDTSAASASPVIVSSLAKTNNNDTSAAQGTTAVTSALAKTNNNDTLAASGSVGGTVTGSLAYTNNNDTSSASGNTTILSTLARTNANDTSSGQATPIATGNLAKTNNNDTLSAVAGTTISGSLNTTNNNDTLSASGSAGSAPIGTVAYTNNNDTSSAQGTTIIFSTSNSTNNNDTLAASGSAGTPPTGITTKLPLTGVGS